MRGVNRYFGYTGIFNLLDWPAVAIPVTKVDPNIDVVDTDYKPAHPLDQAIYEAFDAAKSSGAHAGVQVVGSRFAEEELLGITEIVWKALQAKEAACT